MRETLPKSLPKTDLIAKLAGVQVLGIRSKTKVSEEIIRAAPDLQAIGCFCIGVNQVDLAAANRLGVPVWNAPFSNTRSVAEMIIAEIIALARQLGDRSREVHERKWRKVSAGCIEVRGKTLGIIGYGHIDRRCRCSPNRWACGWCFTTSCPSSSTATASRATACSSFCGCPIL